MKVYHHVCRKLHARYRWHCVLRLAAGLNLPLFCTIRGPGDEEREDKSGWKVGWAEGEFTMVCCNDAPSPLDSCTFVSQRIASRKTHLRQLLPRNLQPPVQAQSIRRPRCPRARRLLNLNPH
ncbi:unnamed protein product [Peniophora sp. CBMAI 1063]|nr:unnamed protein product [Peniophora sp. CBMAI 1063]